MHGHVKVLTAICFFISLPAKTQNVLYFQSGNASDNWSYTSTGADATASAQALNALNYTSAPQSLVVGGNTGGGNCIDGGTGNGPSVERTFTFESVDISSSNQFYRTLSFNWGNRHPVCTGTGWDIGENLIFIPFHDGIQQGAQTLAVGGNDAAFSIHENTHIYVIPPCVNSFSFILYVTTNRRDELLFLDDVVLSTPNFNEPLSPNQVQMNICSNAIPLIWNGQTIDQPGTYLANLVSSTGCDSLVELSVQILPTLESFQTLIICENELPITINGLEISASGSYNFSFLSSSGCDSIAHYQIMIHPFFQVENTIAVCSNELPFLWESQTLTESGQYFSNLTSATGCDSVLILNFTVKPTPILDFSADKTEVYVDNPTVNFTNNSANYDFISWNFADGSPSSSEVNPTHTFPPIPGTYSVTLSIYLDDCPVSGTIDITVKENVDFSFVLPNVFTPNGDGTNDVFTNAVQNAASVELEILNRWGNLVFRTTDPESVWNGTDQNSGEECAEGVYFYRLTIIDKASESHVYHGFVHLIK
jgi:gliding motility-associated-like protein